MERLRQFENIHTHKRDGERALCSLPPKEAIALCRSEENQPYSIEIHPWIASKELLKEFITACYLCREDPRFVAIGECGLDKICNTHIDIQKECFKQALTEAKNLNKPVIIHIVKAWEEMFATVEEIQPNVPLIIHGYRKNGIFARQLVKKGYYISIGKIYNPEVLDYIPTEKIFHETDDL